jgi:putative phosphoribosyl transferase
MFTDRHDAGRQLAEKLRHLESDDVVVLGLPRGGVPVAFEVARALHAPLDVIMVRKLGVPFQPELAMGAIGEGGVRVVDPSIVRATGVSEVELGAVERRERAELLRRTRAFRVRHDRAELAGRTAVVVDDGIATGSTALAACQVARALGAARVVLAAPVAPHGSGVRFADVVDEFVTVDQPRRFHAIGQFYEDFLPTEDSEVVELLGRASSASGSRTPPEERDAFDADVLVGDERLALPGRLTVPRNPLGVVLFAHGSGSSRHSPRNRYVATRLQQAGLGTLLFDLLTTEEEGRRDAVFDIDLLAARLTEATSWLRRHPAGRGLPLGYFGASTGAAAALRAAAVPHADVGAVVSRGGRPDLAGSRLGDVRAPTLLIVGGADEMVLELNRRAQRDLRCENRLAVVPGATHLFEEPGTLARAAELARDWFTDHL